MSRIGKQPISVPNGVTVEISKDLIKVTGPKGTLQQVIVAGVSVKQDGDVIIVERASDEKPHRALHGLYRSLVNNMVVGVTEGFTKNLEVNGVGFKANMNGTALKLSLGFSHDIDFKVPDDVTVEAKNNKITVSGIEKQRVGQVAAQIRELKKPEPYKGKGIKYEDEFIIRKSGKAAGA